MAGAPARPTRLTSNAVEKSPDGNYPWQVSEWLVPHEALRREMLRGAHALDRTDVAAHPWKAFAFHKWLTGFFLPAIHAHHDAEEQIVGPHFQALGEAVADWGKEVDHARLLRDMDVCEKLATELVALVKAFPPAPGPTQEHAAAAAGKLAELKEKWALLKWSMDTHLRDEELTWPPIYLKYGREECGKVVQKIIKEDTAKKGKELEAFKGMLGSVLEAMGALPPPSPQLECGLKLDPWSGEAAAKKFMADLPFVPRVILFPGWHKAYMNKWKRMIDSVAGDANVLRITGAPEAKAGCTCAVM